LLRSVSYISTLIVFALLFSFGCSSQQATIIPKLQINKKSAEMGTPIELTYSFSTKKDFAPLNRDLTVFVHFLDPKGNIRFQDDHVPPKPTSTWRASSNYNYTRTLFIPKNIPAGEYTVTLGIYSPGKGERIDLDASKHDHREYDMGKLLIEIPPQEPIIQYVKGWYDPETVPNDVSTHWRWIGKEAVMKVRNPMSDALLYFKADGVPERFQIPQMVTLQIGDYVVDSFPINSNQAFLKKYNVSKDKLGTNKMLEVKVIVDKTFIPADDKVSADQRELGLRVYDLYLGKASD
jgi:hypothetical protein